MHQQWDSAHIQDRYGSITTREFLRDATLTREMVDRFLDPDALNIFSFDTELGYIPRDCLAHDGVDGSYTINRFLPSGERRLLNFTGQPCRINTYGNSFTQCLQVSDGESWQEYLAAHLGEPIRNFGVGGYGVYQAYRRMLRTENTKSAVEYVILNVWSDDHFRSVYKWRWLPKFEYELVRTLHATVSLPDETWSFVGTPWAHILMSAETGEFMEIENPYPTPESLYLLCDADHVYEAFRDDFGVQVYLAKQHATDVNTTVLQETADAMDLPTDFSSPEATSSTALALLKACGLRASMNIVDKARDFTRSEGKKLVILLSFMAEDVADACKGLPRFDQPFVDHLNENDYLYVDTLGKHVQEFKTFRLSPTQYVGRYYIEHYNPRGNHFFAFAVKDAIVDWLEPKPPTYDRDMGRARQVLAST